MALREEAPEARAQRAMEMDRNAWGDAFREGRPEEGTPKLEGIAFPPFTPDRGTYR